MNINEFNSLVLAARTLYYKLVQLGMTQLQAQREVEKYLIDNGFNFSLINDEARRKSILWVVYNYKA